MMLRVPKDALCNSPSFQASPFSIRNLELLILLLLPALCSVDEVVVAAEGDKEVAVESVENAVDKIFTDKFVFTALILEAAPKAATTLEEEVESANVDDDDEKGIK